MSCRTKKLYSWRKIEKNGRASTKKSIARKCYEDDDGETGIMGNLQLTIIEPVLLEHNVLPITQLLKLVTK